MTTRGLPTPNPEPWRAIDTVSLLRNALGQQQIDIVRASLMLGERPRRYRCSARKMVIMLFAARSGSTYAGQLIANHPAFGRINEWLNPARLARVREKEGLADDRAAAQWVLDEHSREAFGFKCTTVGLVSSALTGVLDQFLDCTTFIVLRREPVAQAVSLYKARLSGRFKHTQQAAREIVANDFDYDGIAESRAAIDRVHANHARALAALGRVATTYWYEEILADPGGFQSSVYAELGLDTALYPGVTTKIEKISDEINDEWIARFRSLERDR